MIRSLSVTVDPSTWPATGTPSFPTQFHSGQQDEDIGLLGMLLLLGHLTTPTVASGVSLSEFWAWVRYVYAIAPQADLRITPEFAELDAHQKTILSDDFGMAISMYWLTRSLDFAYTCDGRYFMDRWPAVAGVPAIKPKKRGPSKSPDFVAIDTSGKLHVIECKGTQSGETYRAKQMSTTLPSGAASGAIVQKRSITVPPAHRGQSLACGLAIATQGQPSPSDLLVVDPISDDTLDVSQNDVDLIVDPPLRASTSRFLRAAGLDIAARTIGTPSGLRAGSRAVEGRFSARQEGARVEGLRRRRSEAEAEITRAMLLPRMEIGGRDIIGRKVLLDLPRPIELEGATYDQVEIKQGVTQDLLQELLGDGLEEGPLNRLWPSAGKLIQPMKTEEDGPSASLWMGGAFASSVKFTKAR